MSEPIAKVESLNGKFYVKSEDGSIRELLKGDVVYKGETVIGDAQNSTFQNALLRLNDGSDIAVLGKNRQLFDASLSKEEFAVNETVTEPKSLLLAIQEDAKFDNGNIDELATAGGENTPADSEHISAEFTQINGAITDVNAALLDTLYSVESLSQVEEDATRRNLIEVDPAVSAVNDAPTITLTSVNNFTEDAPSNAVGS
ncbi:MAG: hypothetical protein QG559_1427, partial [Campylobacterota bacterium]|nr:hypothetical protein [Campylobacterota bacterium]